MSPVRRPVVRSFSLPHAHACASWVRAGGHGVLWETRRRALLVIPIPDPADPLDLGRLAILDMGKARWRVAHEGELQGLAVCLVPPSSHWIVRRRAERDSMHPTPLRETSLDCLACGACCRENEVEIDAADATRLVEAGRGDLLGERFVHNTQGRRMLRLHEGTGRCPHLHADNACDIYALRPKACRDFVVGSEGCLYARELEHGFYDGVPEGE